MKTPESPETPASHPRTGSAQTRSEPEAAEVNPGAGGEHLFAEIVRSVTEGEYVVLHCRQVWPGGRVWAGVLERLAAIALIGSGYLAAVRLLALSVAKVEDSGATSPATGREPCHRSVPGVGPLRGADRVADRRVL